MIDLTKYQQDIKQFYTPEVAADLLTYSREALVAEVGEVVGLRAKRRRGDAGLQDDAAYRQAVVLEMGDVLFSLASIENELGPALKIERTATIYVLGPVTEALHAIIEERLSYYDASALYSRLFSRLWNYATGTDLRDSHIEEIARANIAKLTARQAAGTIRGSGEGEERK